METVPGRKADRSAPIEKLAYSIPEAVQASGVGRSSIYDAIRRGELRSTKKGGRRLIPVDALKAWLSA